MTWDDDGAQPAREIKRGVRAVHVFGGLGVVAAVVGGVYAVRAWQHRPVATAEPAAPSVSTEKIPAYATLLREAGPVDREPPPRLDRLHVRASAQVATIVVGTRSVAMTPPATHVSVVLEEAEINAPFKIEVVSVDGRRWSKPNVSSKGLPIEAQFAGLPAGITNACADGQRTHSGALLDFQDGPDMRSLNVHATVDKKGRFAVWRSTGHTAGTFAGTYSGEGLRQLDEAAHLSLTNAFPVKRGRPSTVRRVIANDHYASFSEGDALPPAWITLIEATANLVDLAAEVPWAGVGLEVARDGKLRLVQRGCHPVHVTLIGAEVHMALESTTSGLTRKSWSSPRDVFGLMNIDYDLAPGGSHAVPLAPVPGFEPAPGERLVVHLKARMERNFDAYVRTLANIDIEGATSL